jgi:hypothetical protein
MTDAQLMKSTRNQTPMENNEWILSSERLPDYYYKVEGTYDKIYIDSTLVFLESKTCMLAGTAGGYGYFGEGFATDESATDYGLICFI